MDDIEIKEFLEFLKEVKEGKLSGPFGPIKYHNDDIAPQTWEELIERIKNLPGDDPIIWLPLTKEN